MLVAHMCVSVHNVSLLWCADMDVSECVSLSSPCVSACLCVSVCMWVCWEGMGGGGGGLMGSVGARVPGEQLSLIIQTRLIIKAAQISP